MQSLQHILLPLYKEHLSSRKIYHSIRVSRDYVSPSNLGQYYEAGKFRQVNALEGNCLTALHESIHFINREHRDKIKSVLQEQTSALTGNHILMLSKKLVQCSMAYRTIAWGLLRWALEKDKNIFLDYYYQTTDELLAQSAGSSEFWKMYPSVITELWGENLTKFLMWEVCKPEYFPQWNERINRYE